MLVRYAISLSVMSLLVVLKRVNDVSGGSVLPFFLFFGPLLLIAWFAGFGPSMVSAVLVVVAARQPYEMEYRLRRAEHTQKKPA